MYGERHKGRRAIPAPIYCTVTLTTEDGMPFDTTCKVRAPVSIVVGTSKCVETLAVPVATPMLLWSWVRA